MLNFAADVIDAMDVSIVRVADIVYSTTVVVHFDFNDYTTNMQARSKMLTTPKRKLFYSYFKCPNDYYVILSVLCGNI